MDFSWKDTFNISTIGNIFNRLQNTQSFCRLPGGVVLSSFPDCNHGLNLFELNCFYPLDLYLSNAFSHMKCMLVGFLFIVKQNGIYLALFVSDHLFTNFVITLSNKPSVCGLKIGTCSFAQASVNLGKYKYTFLVHF